MRPASVTAVAAVFIAARPTFTWPTVVVRTPPARNLSAVLDLCRATVRDVQPFVLIVYALSDEPDECLRLVHDTVGAAVLLTDGSAAIRAGATADVRPDQQVVLMIADGPADVERLIADGSSAWDPMSHYLWLMPDVDRSAAGALFRAAWRRRSVVHAVAVATDATVAYTYDPFKNVLRKRPATDTDGLRTVARLKMTDLNGHPVRVCMFPTRLKAVKQPDGTYTGTDGNMVTTLAQRMNFTPVYSEPTDGHKYGWAEADQGSESNYMHTGLLADLVHNKVDMAFNGAFLNVMPVIFLSIFFPRHARSQISSNVMENV